MNGGRDISKEVRVLVRIKNNRMLERREALGLTQSEMAEVIGMSKVYYADLENLKRSPVADGKWTEEAVQVAEYYDCDTEELFPQAIQAIKASTIERCVDVSDLVPLALSSHSERLLLPPDEQAIRVDMSKKLEDAMTTLRPREQDVLKKHYGFDGDEMTYKEIGKSVGRSVERQRQLHEQALGKMRKLAGYGKLSDLPVSEQRLFVSQVVEVVSGEMEEVSREPEEKKVQRQFERVIEIVDAYPDTLPGLRYAKSQVERWIGREARMKVEVSKAAFNKLNLIVYAPSDIVARHGWGVLQANLKSSLVDAAYDQHVRLIFERYNSAPTSSKRSSVRRLEEDAVEGGFSVLSRDCWGINLALDGGPDHREEIMRMRLWFGSRADLHPIEVGTDRIYWFPVALSKG
jgi:RNA polymerase sigma factor (sigma-70 family)